MGLRNPFNRTARRQQMGRDLLAEVSKPRGTADLALAFDLVARGASLEERNNDGCTPLMVSVLRGYTPLALELIDHGADVNTRDAQGGTALIFAAKFRNNEIAKALLAKGAEADVQDSLGFSPLRWAKENNLSDMTSQLEQARAGKHAAAIEPRLPKNYDPPLE